MVKQLFCFKLLFLLLIGTQPLFGQKDSFRFSLMTYNVENLFDTKHDEGKDDYAYLPFSQKLNRSHIERCAEIDRKPWRLECLLLDWNQEALIQKMNAISKVILHSKSYGPDILVLVEVENRPVLDELVQRYLKSSQYKEKVLIEGPDYRGIDVAILSRFPLKRPAKLHPIKFTRDLSGNNDTRGVLEASFILPDGSNATILGVHFPAPHHPAVFREDAIKSLNKIALQQDPKDLIIAAGDFNFASGIKEDQKTVRQLINPYWIKAHESNCPQCKGTYFYHPNNEWSFLDLILIKKDLSPKLRWSLDERSVRVINHIPEQVTKEGNPKSFVSGKGGVSDHFPLYAEFAAGP